MSQVRALAAEQRKVKAPIWGLLLCAKLRRERANCLARVQGEKDFSLVASGEPKSTRDGSRGPGRGATFDLTLIMCYR